MRLGWHDVARICREGWYIDLLCSCVVCYFCAESHSQALGIEVLCREPRSWLSAKPGAHDTGSDFSSEQWATTNSRCIILLWRPRFLINVINANDRISRVKPVKHWSNLGQPGSSHRKPHHWTLLNPLTKPTHTRSQPVVKGTVQPRLTVDVSGCRPELLPRCPKFT
jgi:hypothetical protein